MPNSDDILIDVQNVSKKFCRDFKKSLWYGVQDTASDLFRRNKGQASPEADTTTPNLPHSSFQNSSFPPSLREGEFWANQNISFQVRRGECLGLIGHNGAGKTTLLKMLNGLIKPDTGTITMKGRIGALIALGAGFNPILTGRENIYVNGSILGLSKKEIDAKLEEIVDFAEIEEAIDAPVRTYSSGMQVRLGFAVAVVLIRPDVLLLDEVLAVGDSSFQAKCFSVLGKLRAKGTAFLLVTHQLDNVGRICTKTSVMARGKMVFNGGTQDGLDFYRSLAAGQNEDNIEVLSQPSGIKITPSPSSHYTEGEIAIDLDIQRTGSRGPFTGIVEVRCYSKGTLIVQDMGVTTNLLDAGCDSASISVRLPLFAAGDGSKVSIVIWTPDMSEIAFWAKNINTPAKLGSPLLSAISATHALEFHNT